VRVDDVGRPDAVEPESVEPVDREWTDLLDSALDQWAEGAATRVALPTRGRTPPWAWVALAASVVGILTLTQVPWGSPGSEVGPDTLENPTAAAPGLALRASELDVAAPGPFMLVPTRDPSITVVWILNSPDESGESS